VTFFTSCTDVVRVGRLIGTCVVKDDISIALRSLLALLADVGRVPAPLPPLD